MVQSVTLEFSRPVHSTAERYDLLSRISRLCRRHGIAFLAYALREQSLGLVLDGKGSGIDRVLLGVRRGMAHRASRRGSALTVRVAEQPVDPEPSVDVAARIAACHRSARGADPLAEPWTSHRDLLGLRDAPHFDPAPARARVDPLVVHRLAGGGPLPQGWPPSDPGPVPLATLLRVSAAVIGVVPADRRSFPIFVHLARSAGHPVQAIAASLMLTPRRVRQILEDRHPSLHAARAYLADPRLQVVP